jgi:hypothetical protein
VPGWQRAYLAVCAGIVGFTLGYVIVDYLKIPRVFHFQHEHDLGWRRTVSDPVPSGYVGLWLWALIAGLVLAAVALGVTRFVKRPLAERGLGLALAWAGTAFAIAAGYYTWNNWP